MSLYLRCCFYILFVALAGCEDEDYTLAKQHCSTCHGFVSPGMVSRLNWQTHVLPNMASNLGIPVFGETEYMNNPYIPSAVPFDGWIKIVNYYLKNAPEKLMIPDPPQPVIRDWSIFTLKKPSRSHYSFSKTTLLRVDTATNNIYTSDANTAYLYRWNNKLELLDSTRQTSPIVSASFFNDTAGKRQGVFTAIGEMRPHDNNKGSFAADRSGQ